MHRILTFILLALVTLQFSWVAVAVYCGHEEQVDAGHFGHHAHQHHGDAGNTTEPVADLDTTADVQGDKTLGSMDLDCGHCHGTCAAMLTLASSLPDVLPAASPSATLDETDDVHASARPERPQWLSLA